MCQAHAARQLRKIEQTGAALRQQGEQARHLGQLLELRQFTHITLQDGLDVAVKPGAAPGVAGAGDRLRVTALCHAFDQVGAVQWRNLQAAPTRAP